MSQQTALADPPVQPAPDASDDDAPACPSFPVELRGGVTPLRGLVSPLSGTDLPRSIRVDGHTYVLSGDLFFGGSESVHHVYTRDVRSTFRPVAGGA